RSLLDVAHRTVQLPNTKKAEQDCQERVQEAEEAEVEVGEGRQTPLQDLGPGQPAGQHLGNVLVLPRESLGSTGRCASELCYYADARAGPMQGLDPGGRRE